MFQIKLANKNFYTVNIRKMKLKLAKLQELDKKIQKIRAKSLDRYKDVNRVLHYQGLLFISEIIQIKLISRYHNIFLASYFGINKTRELIN